MHWLHGCRSNAFSDSLAVIPRENATLKQMSKMFVPLASNHNNVSRWSEITAMKITHLPAPLQKRIVDQDQQDKRKRPPCNLAPDRAPFARMGTIIGKTSLASNNDEKGRVRSVS